MPTVIFFFWCFTVIKTATLTDDNRNIYDVNESEEHQSNICAPVLFNTECEEQMVDKGKFFLLIYTNQLV